MSVPPHQRFRPVVASGLRIWAGLAALVVVVTAAAAAVPDAILMRPALRKIHPALRSGPGRQANVLVRLADAPVVARLGRHAKQLGYKLDREAQVAYTRRLLGQQAEVAAKLRASGARIVGHLTASQNAVLAVVDTGVLADISEMPAVLAIRPVVDSRLTLSETVPHVGAAALHAGGVTGDGIRVAVLDSGIDYTHAHFGGPGTTESYAEAYGSDPSDPANRTRDGRFPTTKVIGGWDFVGEVWPSGPEGVSGPIEPDEDPIDYGGHGTHVADIVAGANLDGTHVGVAPGAKLYAFKTCSAVSVECNGFATLLALDACLHPDNPVVSVDLADNGELLGLVENPVDVINLSSGAGYGMIQDDSAYVVQLLSDFGITVVAAAGNGGDLPYIVDSPGVAPGAIAVAETQVPSAKAHTLALIVPSNRGGTAKSWTALDTADLTWAPVDREVDGIGIGLGRGCSGDAYPVPDSQVAGKVAVVDRGACDVSEKVDRAARLGAIGVVIVDHQPGSPSSFGRGEGSRFVPSLVVGQVDGAMLRTLLIRSPKSRITFGPEQVTSLAGSMVAQSSRGPSYSFQAIKPEIGAPGASVSAVAGTGNGTEAFGGTSGATPVVAGAAALLQSVSLAQSGLYWAPWAIKALLMNQAEPDIVVSPVARPVIRAPASRIGAGELRIDRALAATAFAVVFDSPIEPGAPEDVQASLSFGYQPVTGSEPRTFTKTVAVVNLTTESRTFVFGSSFRYPDDEATGALSIGFSTTSLAVPPEGQAEVEVTLTLLPTRLRDWTLNGGSHGHDGELLRVLEYDGLIRISDDRDSLALPWHILPRKAADMVAGGGPVESGGEIPLTNANGARTGVTEVFALGGTSPLDYPKPDTFGFNEAWPDLAAAGVRTVGDYLEFALTFHHEWTHPITPAACLVFLDTDGDGLEDLEFYTTEGSPEGTTVTEVSDLHTGALLGTYPVDADMNASTMILRAPLADLGLSAESPVDWYAMVMDNYFTGNLTDIVYDEATVGYLRHTPGRPRYLVSGGPTLSLPPGTGTGLKVAAVAGGAEASPSQHGFLFVHRQAMPGRGSDVVEIVPPAAPHRR